MGCKSCCRNAGNSRDDGWANGRSAVEGCKCSREIGFPDREKRKVENCISRELRYNLEAFTFEYLPLLWIALED